MTKTQFFDISTIQKDQLYTLIHIPLSIQLLFLAKYLHI
jgi:hypothetical protein